MPALIAGLGLIPSGRVTAQNFITLHHFEPATDGAFPQAELILSSNTFYGTTYQGGSSGKGTVFRVNADGYSFTNLHNFAGSPGDGAYSYTGLELSDNTLYGTTSRGGSSGVGMVFAISTDGTSFTNLHNFTGGDDGAYPFGRLILSGNRLYGTTAQGGLGRGTVFAININGTGFTNLHSFTIGIDGKYSNAGLILSGNTLYGTTESGGSSGDWGMVFAINTDGTGYTNLHNFFGDDGGGRPRGELILSSNTLYGTTSSGGSARWGTVFRINTDGTVFTNLYNFTNGIDGSAPSPGLILLGNTLYGTASGGGSSGRGTVFAINTDGTDFKTMYNFTPLSVPYPYTNSDGAIPYGGLLLANNTVYGTAADGGSSGAGTVFSLSLPSPPLPPPTGPLRIIHSGENVILTWPTNVSGTLQSAPTVISSNEWITVSPAPTVVNSENTVTNPVSGAQKFYRLSQ